MNSSKRHFLLTTFLLGAVALDTLAGPGGWDQSYAPSLIGGPVYTMALQPDGKALIGGNFFMVNNSSSRAHLARLLSDGSLDTTFFNSGSGVSSAVWCLAVQTDNRILIGGDFNSINGTNRTRIARLNSNGGVDGTFVPTNTITSSVLALAVQSDNKVVIGGNFSGNAFPSWNARLNADGTLDASFSSFPTGPVNAIAIQTDGKIVIGGAFTQLNGAARNRIARLNADGSLDNTFQNGLAGTSGTVRCVLLQSDGKILIGGDFTTVNGTNRGFVARLNSNGSLDTGFNTALGANAPVYALALQPDNSVVIGGLFSTYASANSSHLARLFPDGSRDSTFTTFGINNTIQALAVQSDGGLLAGGMFTTINNTNQLYLGRFYGNLYPPEFIVQPISRSTNVGATVKFSAQVNNPTPSNFQWRKDGNNIGGATGAAYTLFNVQFADAGKYSVFVSNGAGGITSTNAVLNVGIAPVITAQPASLVVTQGQTASFTVGATGTPLQYFWKKNGTFITGATDSAFTIANVVQSNAAIYTCQVSNFLGNVTSAGATLTVYSPPVIAVQPMSQIVGVGSNATLSVIATGNPTPVYQWTKDGSNIPGASDSTYTLNSIQTNDAGGYAVILTNIFATVTSSVANISVLYYPPTIASQPLGATLLVGSNFNLTVAATGTAPLSFEWRKNGSDLSGASFTSYSVTGAQTNDAGDYTVVVTNIVGSITSTIARVNVGYAPLITVQPQPFTNNLGTSNAFSVTVFGSEPLLYQWVKDGVLLTDATNSLLPLPNLQSNQVGYYSVNVTNLYGWASSSNALLTIPGVSLPFYLQGLVAYYPFNGNANDESGYSNNGVNTNCQLSTDRLGHQASAYSFNGTSSDITAPDQSYLNLSSPSNFTISVWATRSASQSFSFLVGKDDGNNRTPATKWILILGRYHDPSTPTLTFHYIDANNTLHWIGASSIIDDYGVWHQYAVSRSGDTYSIFQDGVLIETEIDSGTLPSDNPAPLTIGSSEGDGWHAGLIDDVRIYNRALSSNEVAQLFAIESDLPVITNQPQSKIVLQGSTVSFSVGALAQNPLTYQWSEDGVAISTGTNSILSIPNVQPTNAGLYSVTVSNSFAGTVSAPATLTVMSSTGSGAPGFTSNQFGFGLSGAVGTSFSIEASTNLINWQPVFTNSFGPGLFQYLDPASVTNSLGFYRVRTE